MKRGHVPQMLVLASLIVIAMMHAPQLAYAQAPEELTTYIVQLAENGSAMWIVEYRFLIASEEDEQGFMEYVKTLGKDDEEIRARFLEWATEIVSEAAKLTGREMSVENLNVEVELADTITGKFGVIRIAFLWKGFAERVGEELRVGDVFEGGLYLFEGDVFTIRAPSGFTLTEAYPEPDKLSSSEASWFGKRVFSPSEPRVIVAPAVGEPAPATQTTTTEDTQPSATPMIADTSLLTILAVLAIVVLFGVLAIALSKRHGRLSRQSTDLMTVMGIIKRHGGEVLQSTIVEETGFSKAKVSALLKEMEEMGYIVRERMGRENIVRLLRE